MSWASRIFSCTSFQKDDSNLLDSFDENIREEFGNPGLDRINSKRTCK